MILWLGTTGCDPVKTCSFSLGFHSIMIYFDISFIFCFIEVFSARNTILDATECTEYAFNLIWKLKAWNGNIQTLLWAGKWCFKGEHGQTWESENLCSSIVTASFAWNSLLSIITSASQSPSTSQLLAAISSWILWCVSGMFCSWILYRRILFSSLNVFSLNVFLFLLIKFCMEWGRFLTV